MNGKMDMRIFWGGLLILGGILFLLQNLGYFQLANSAWGIILGIAGLFFLMIVIGDRNQWWALIPGMILTYLGLLILLTPVFPAGADVFGGALFLAVIGLSFWLIYFLQPHHWWAIIPGGTLLTLGIVTASTSVISGIETGAIFFLGLGATFVLLALINTGSGKMRWPLIPGGILLALGLITGLAATSIFNYLWPVALILAGLYLFFLRTPVRR